MTIRTIAVIAFALALAWLEWRHPMSLQGLVGRALGAALTAIGMLSVCALIGVFLA